MKLVCFADTHAGVKNYGKVDKDTGLNEREIQTLNLLEQTIDYAINNKVDCVVCAGDTFHKNLPSPTLINKVNKILYKLSYNKIKTFVIDGNHDVSKLTSSDSGIAQFDTLNIPYFTHSRFYKEELFTVNDTTYRFVLLPTYYTKDEIEEYMNDLNSSYPTFIVFHGSINNAQLNDWNTIESDKCIDKEIFYKKNVLAVICGHFHKHQILNENPLIFYTGSTNRIDFSEEKQKKGFVELDIVENHVEHKFIELQAQKFVTIDLNCEDANNPIEIEDRIIKEIDDYNIDNAILRIRLNLTENIIINEKKILEYAYIKNVYYMLNIQKKLPNVKSIITDSINNTLSMEESLLKYYKDQKRGKERVELALDIVKQVEK